MSCFALHAYGSLFKVVMCMLKTRRRYSPSTEAPSEESTEFLVDRPVGQVTKHPSSPHANRWAYLSAEWWWTQTTLSVSMENRDDWKFFFLSEVKTVKVCSPTTGVNVSICTCCSTDTPTCTCAAHSAAIMNDKLCCDTLLWAACNMLAYNMLAYNMISKFKWYFPQSCRVRGRSCQLPVRV